MQKKKENNTSPYISHGVVFSEPIRANYIGETY